MMEAASNKMNHVIKAVLFILVVIFSATLYLQGIKLHELKERFDVNSQAGNPPIEINAESSTLAKKLSQDNEERYIKRIEKLETQIADMQEWQDYLKETLDEYDRKADSLIPIWRQTSALSQADYFLHSPMDFFEQNNYPPELKQKLRYLFNKRDNTLNSTTPDLMSFVPGKINGNLAELVQQTEQIKAEYDEELAKLLSKEDLALFKEYEQRGFESYMFNGLNDWLGEDKIGKEKGKELIALWYNYRQIFRKEQIKKAQSYKINRDGPDDRTMARIQKDNIEYNIKLYENYGSLAEGILSESQMEVFEGTLNSIKSSFSNDNKNIHSSDEQNSED